MLCVALAFLGMSGVHAHLPGASESGGPHVHTEGGNVDAGEHARVMSILDAEHVHAHDDHGDIDIDSITKAFGKTTLLKLFSAAIFAFVVLDLLNRLPSQRMAFCRLLRPPKNRRRFSLLPQSHAPPSTALLR
jgi:hypothetical protein